MYNEIKKLRNSFKYALRGIRQGFHYERNFRIHFCAGIYVTFFAFISKTDKLSFMFLILCFALMLSSELVNTAFEKLCDIQAMGYNKLIRDAKDIAAGAVLVSAVFCLCIGILVFYDKQVLFNIEQYFRNNLWVFMGFILSVPASVYYVCKGRFF